MVSKARDDLPEPLGPVMTVKVLRGISTLMFLRLCCRAPLTVIRVIAMNKDERGMSTPRKPGGGSRMSATAYGHDATPVFY